MKQYVLDGIVHVSFEEEDVELAKLLLADGNVNDMRHFCNIAKQFRATGKYSLMKAAELVQVAKCELLELEPHRRRLP